jgi:FkbM family methyltransferase
MQFRDENGKIINHLVTERNEQVQAEKYLTPKCIVLELGARYGTVSCIINKKVGPNMVVVEPDVRVQDALEQNMKANGCDFNIVKGVISRVPLELTEQNKSNGYGTTSIKTEESSIPSMTLEEVETKYNLVFNTLVADCEGFLEQFMDENPKLYQQLSLIMFEKDYANKCNYKKIENTLKANGFACLNGSFHSVWKKTITNT